MHEITNLARPGRINWVDGEVPQQEHKGGGVQKNIAA